MSRKDARVICWREPIGAGLIAANCSIDYRERGCPYGATAFVVLSDGDRQWQAKARQRLSNVLAEQHGGRVPVRLDWEPWWDS